LPAQERASHATGKLFVYLLDKDPSKQDILSEILRKTRFSSFDVYEGTGGDDAQNTNIAPPVERWIQGFRDADFVFTDSFHGCVFSILFKKPFIVYGNPQRGLARFESLLGMFNLAQRMIDRAEAVEDLLDQPPIDWRKVMDILNTERAKGRQFLVNALNG
jgi:exopolysaccharide biosynthesis predicted pyruvyltransferase EpsI